MDLFAPILGMTMIVVGLIGFTVCVSLMIYFAWQENQEPPVEQSVPLAVSDGRSAGGNPVECWRRRRAYLRGKRRRRV